MRGHNVGNLIRNLVANMLILKTEKDYYHDDSNKGLYNPNVDKTTRTVLKKNIKSI